MSRRLSPAEREHQALPLLRQPRRAMPRRPRDLADIACAIGALAIALILAVTF